MSKIEEVYEQLRPYQIQGNIVMEGRLDNLNFDDMGLGKTLTTLITVLRKNPDLIDHPGQIPPVLIACPTNALYVWEDEIRKWFDMNSIIYAGTPAARQKKMLPLIPRYPFVITTYGMLEELGKYKWTALIADEIHVSGLLNHKTKTYKTVQTLSKNIGHLYLLTGTPIRQGVIDLYAPLHLVNPEEFPNYWQFVGKHCITIDTPFGKQIQRNPKDIDAFRKILDKYMIRRLKSEVLKDLPGKQRQPITLQMTPLQEKVYKSIIEDFMFVDEDNAIVAQNAMSAILRIRQLLCSPRLLGLDDDGAALNYIRETGVPLLEAGKPFVIFTPFRQALPIIKDVIKEMNGATHVYVLEGGMSPAGFANQWQGFQNDKAGMKVLICVIKSGASFHATAADVCFFLGYEWDFNFNAQAEDRLCRLGQKNFVTCYYPLHKDNVVDDNVRQKLNDKQTASTWVIGTEQQYKSLLQAVKLGGRKI
jgi:SNF2 family DNA or RNA helicase